MEERLLFLRLANACDGDQITARLRRWLRLRASVSSCHSYHYTFRARRRRRIYPSRGCRYMSGMYSSTCQRPGRRSLLVLELVSSRNEWESPRCYRFIYPISIGRRCFFASKCAMAPGDGVICRGDRQHRPRGQWFLPRRRSAGLNSNR